MDGRVGVWRIDVRVGCVDGWMNGWMDCRWDV